MKLYKIPGSTPARAHRRLAAGVVVAGGLGLLLLAFAGCGQASPSDAQIPVVTVVPAQGSVTEGAPLQFHVRADPAPREDLAVSVAIASSGCELAQSRASVTITAGASLATLQVPTADVDVGAEGCEVTATIAPGKRYVVSEGGTVDGSDPPAVTITEGETPDTPDDESPEPGDSGQEGPWVSISRLVTEVTEGGLLQFSLTADPAPAVPLTVNLLWDDPGVLAGTPPATVTIPTSGAVTVTAATTDDDIENSIREVHVSVVDGTGYRVRYPNRAGILVNNDDFYPRVTIVADTATVAEGGTVSFTLTATPPPASPLTVNLHWLYETAAERLVAPPPRYDSVTIPTTGTYVVTLQTVDDLVDNYFTSEYLGVQVHNGNRYVVARPSTATVTLDDDEFTPLVSVAADTTSVVEGNDISFTLTAEPAPVSALTVNLGWVVSGNQLSATPPDTATISTAGTAKIVLATIDDTVDNSADTTVRINLVPGDFYFRDVATASITIEDDDD